MNSAGDNKINISCAFKNVTSTKQTDCVSFNSLSITTIKKIRSIQHFLPLDFEHSNISELSSHCDTCFPMMKECTPIRGRYVDLLEFSNFNGVPYTLPQESKKPSRWFPDIRYCFSASLPHQYPSVTKEVLKSARVQKAIEKMAGAQSEKLSTNILRQKASQFFDEIRAKLSTFVCRICSYLLYKVFRRIMTKLLVCKEELERLQKAELTEIPIVYLPLHRSHLDYLLITWCNWHFSLKLPHIASGDNLNLSGLGWLLRATGAFFIRRRVGPNDEGGKDVLYRAVLHSYIEQILKKNMPIEFFSEGTRNRFGKVLTPKNGLISNIVEAVQQGTIKDCYLVPVSYTYDAVIEGIFLNELMGVPKVRESVFRVFKGVFKTFSKSQQCGVVRMNYGRPVLLSTYLSAMTCAISCKTSKPSSLTRMTHSFSYRELVPWHRSHSETVDDRSTIRAIGFHVIYEAQMMCSISPVAVVSCLLLTKFRKGIDRFTLEEDCQWLCEKIIFGGGDVSGFIANQSNGVPVVQYALQKLKYCVEVSNSGDFIKPIADHKSFIQLAYNKNSLICRFSIESAIAIAIMCRSPSKAHNIQQIVEDTLSICDWLQFDFLFCRPCDNLRELVHNVLSKNEWCHDIHGILRLDFEDIGFVEYGDGTTEAIKIRDKKSQEILSFYANLIRPFLQSLYIVAFFISSEEFSVEPIAENVVVRNLCKDSLTKKIKLPFEPMLESINSDSFKNSIRILKEKGFLSKSQPGKVSKSKNVHINEVVSNLERVLNVFN